MTGRHAQRRRWTPIAATGGVCALVGAVVGLTLSATGATTGSPNETCTIHVQNGIVDPALDCTPDPAAPSSSAPTTGPTDSPTPSTVPTTSSPTDPPTTPNPTSTTPAPTMTESPTQLPTGGFPDATNTGVQAGTALRNVPADVTSGAGWHWDSRGWVVIDGKGAVFSGYEVHSSINVQADNVTVSNNRVVDPGDMFGIAIRHADNTTVTRNTISGGTSGGPDTKRLQFGIKDIYSDTSGTQITGNNIFDISGGIALDSGLVQDNYVHDMGWNSTDHVDCYQSFDVGDANLMIRHNTFLNPNDQTSAILFQWSSTKPSGHTVTDNLLGGGGYVIYGGDNATGVKITGNEITTRYWPKGGYYGVLAHYQSNTGNAFTGNTWADGKNAGTAAD